MPGIPVYQVELLRNIVSDDYDKIAVQSMSPPSYLKLFLSDTEGTDNVILVYKINTKSSASSLPIEYGSSDDSNYTDLDVTGNPLENPFEDEKFEETVVSLCQFPWMKGELNQLPLPIQDARVIVNSWNDAMHLKDVDEDGTPLLDFWILTDDEKHNCSADSVLSDSPISSNSQISDADPNADCISTVLLGRHLSTNWYSRSVIKANGICSISSSKMDPEVLLQRHLLSSKLPASKVRAHVLCRYTLSGHPVEHDPMSTDLSTIRNPSSVSLELTWNKLSLSVPLENATTKLITQVGIGHPSSPAYGLWKQLLLLHKLLDTLVTCWRDKKTPTSLPHEQLCEENGPDITFETLESKLESLIRSGGSVLTSQHNVTQNIAAPTLKQDTPSVSRRSVAPGFLGRRSLAPGIHTEENSPSACASLLEALNITQSSTRENIDITDELWNLLIKCKSYEELSKAWTLVFSELSQGYSRPYIRPKNQTRAAKLIQTVMSGHVERGPHFFPIEGSGICEPLELLVEIGLQKLAADYSYIFIVSRSASRDCLLAPELVRNDITVSRDNWLATCGCYLGWLAQVHTSLEVMLPLYKSFPSPEKVLYDVTPMTLKHFQSDASPVRSVDDLLRSCWQEFNCVVSTMDMQNILTEKFDLLKLTLLSESDTRIVKSVFIRSSQQPIFPPQIHNCRQIFSVGPESMMYHCAESLTLSDNLGSKC